MLVSMVYSASTPIWAHWGTHPREETHHTHTEKTVQLLKQHFWRCHEWGDDGTFSPSVHHLTDSTYTGGINGFDERVDKKKLLSRISCLHAGLCVICLNARSFYPTTAKQKKGNDTQRTCILPRFLCITVLYARFTEHFE